MKEVEAAVQSLYNTTKEKTEEHVKSVANMEKWRLGAEEKVNMNDKLYDHTFGKN